jgi:hypothetical protein
MARLRSAVERALTGVVATALVCAVLSMAGVAHAAGSESPEALINQGVQLRRRGDDARALGYIRRAYELGATPRTAAQLGLVELALGQFADADGHLSEALRAKDPWVEHNRPTLDSSRELARKHLLRVELAGAPADTTFALEQETPRSLPNDGVIWVAAGPRRVIRLRAPDKRETTAEVEGREGQAVRIVVSFPAPAPPSDVAAAPPAGAPAGARVAGRNDAEGEPRTSTAPISAIALATAGVAAGVVGGVFLAEGLSKRNKYQAEVDSKGTVGYDPSVGNWKTDVGLGIGCLVGGAALIAVGTGIFVTDHRSSASAGSVAVTPLPSGTLISYGGTF